MTTLLPLLFGLWMQAAPQPAPKVPQVEAGIQLYSLRNELKNDIPGTLAWIKAQGITMVETYGTLGLTPQQFRAELDKAGLRAVSMHAGLDRLKQDPDAVAAEAKVLGASCVGVAWYPHQGDVFTLQDAQKAIADFNAIGKAMSERGLTFFYHNHGYEFQPAPGGGTLFDLIATSTDPQQVKFQMDVFWVLHPGQDPAALLRKYPGRFLLMHMKDMQKGVKGDLSGHGKDEWSVAMGTGQADWPAILKAAKKAGVKYFLIEDEAPAVQQQVPQSLRYLRGS